ncbi:leucine-rich repeat protein [Metamycoplasma hyosynoviae]|uniref:leucine-rich repeat protein n=1 Tax=Metamycoplasma hyosynoviae TaxID=29559 RepID=UPI0023611A1F|nr:leucine-rich repeat protein [Metamycoplasma hyosynoviae]MDD1373997.1 leucine-rich repeat protein [Metamycoplasma hyosynoviae]
MKEQEQKQQIKKEEPPKQVKQETTKAEEKSQSTNQDKVKTQNPKNKVIIWSTTAAAAAALSSVVSFTTVFSNQRKVSFLDKVLQSIKIDVKDKENKTRDDIKSITDFVASGLNNKLYELIVETEDNQVNKQLLDKDKPYTTFRTKFAIRNKYTKAQSNYQNFEFRDIKPPKEKAELDKLGQISLNGKDRFNDKVKIEFSLDFNRNIRLASEVAEKDENGNFKHFQIYPKLDNNDAFQYEVINVNVKTDDEKSTAIFSYQLKVKSIDDDKFTSNVLEVKFDDFAKTSTQLTQYLNQLSFSYEDASSTFAQDAVQTKVVAKKDGSNLQSNYELIFNEFKPEGEYPKKVKAIVKLRDNVNNIISEAITIEIEGFKNYQTPTELNAYAEQIKLDVKDKNTQYISEINNYDQILKNSFDKGQHEIDRDTFVIEKLEDLTSINVHFRIREKHGRPEIYSSQKTIKIEGFKIPQRLLNEWADKIVLNVQDKEQKMAYEFWDDFSKINIRQNIDDNKVEFASGATVKQTGADELTIRFQIQDKSDQNVKSITKEVKIDGFKKDTVNSDKFSYYLYEHNGHKAACLNKRNVEFVFEVPNKIDSYKVLKATSLYVYENLTRPYAVTISEGIEEVENLIYTSSQTANLLAVSLPKTTRVAKNVVIGPTKKLLYMEMPSSVEQAEGLFEGGNIELGDTDYFERFYYNYGAEKFRGKNPLGDTHPQNWKGGFKLKLYDVEGKEKKYRLETNSENKYSFLVKNDGNKLVKLIENKNTPDNLNLELTFSEIVPGAFHGSKAKKLELTSNVISSLENLFSISNSSLEELDLSKVANFKTFSKLGPSVNNIKKVILPDNMTEDIEFSFYGWGKLEEIKLPKNAKRILTDMFYECKNLKKINLEELTNLEQIGKSDNFEGTNIPQWSHFMDSDKITKLDFSNTKLKRLSSGTFPFMRNLEEIIFPSSLKEVGYFIAYVTYNSNNGTPTLEDDTIGLEKKLTIKVKGINSKPSGWCDRWIGSFWSSENPDGTDKSKVEIKWNATD